MKRLNIAMLGEQAQEQVREQQIIDENNEALATDQDAAQIQQQDAEIDEIQGVVQETQDAADCICQTAEKIERMPEVSQEVVQIAQEQIAYFAKRTGMKMSGVTAAMESYSADKAGNKEALVKQMNLAVESLNKSVAIAQEGIVDRIKNRLSAIFTSRKKLAAELEEVSKAYDAAGQKEGVIKDPAFARTFNKDNKPSIDGKEVVTFVEKLLSVAESAELIKRMKEAGALMDKLTVSLSKTSNWEDKAESDKIKKISIELDTLTDEIDKMLDFKIKKNSTDVEPATAAEKAKLAKAVQSLLGEAAISAEMDKYEKSLDGLVAAYYPKATGLGYGSKDLEIVKLFADTTFEVFWKIGGIMSDRFTVAHATVKYIKASTAGKTAAKEQAPAKQAQA